MKNIKTKLLLLLITALIISCSKDEEGGIAGVDDFSGDFSLSFVANSLTEVCTNNSSSTGGTGSTSSSNDLEITSNGRFKQKIYSLDSSNECTVSEILEGQITINGSFHEAPYGIIEFDDSGKTYNIQFSKSTLGKHNTITINYDNNIIYTYRRSN